MDNQIRPFMRVVRKLDNANDLIQSFPEWEKSAFSYDAAPPSLSAQDQRRVLDFPDPDTQAANIAKSSPLTKAELVKRAAEMPEQLSATEVALLKDRYWLDVSQDEESKVLSAQGLISGPYRVSEEEFEEAGKRLRAVRHLLYAENEERAIDNAVAEHWRRRKEVFQARQKEEAEEYLSKAFPWVRRIWEEDQGKKRWGYGIFVDPEAFVDGEEAEEYMIRRDAVLFHARGAIGVGSSVLNNMWTLQRVVWPMNTTAGDSKKEGGDQAAQKSVDNGESEDSESYREASDDRRAVYFQRLREHFISIRDRAPKGQRQEPADVGAPTEAQRIGLQEGIAQNVFLVVDKDSAASVLSRYGFVDDMWVWAVDPDYDGATSAATTCSIPEDTIFTTGTPSSSSSSSSYKGFMRVRLQQLVNNFYDARRFHEDEYPMAKLYEAAQKSAHQAFVSLKDDEVRSRNMDRFIGSAMRAQPPRIMYGPKQVATAGPEARAF